MCVLVNSISVSVFACVCLPLCVSICVLIPLCVCVALPAYSTIILLCLLGYSTIMNAMCTTQTEREIRCRLPKRIYVTFVMDTMFQLHHSMVMIVLCQGIVLFILYTQTLFCFVLLLLLLWVVIYCVSSASVSGWLFPPLLPLSAPVSSSPTLSSFQLLFLFFGHPLFFVICRLPFFVLLFSLSIHFLSLSSLPPASLLTLSLPHLSS